MAGPLPGTAAGSQQQIHVMRWEGSQPVAPHTHDFVEIAFLTHGSCIHAWRGSNVRLVPGDTLIIAPQEEHAYQIEGPTVIWNCLFYPTALDDDWSRLQQDTALQNLLVLEPLYRQANGRQAILHFNSQESEQLESLLLKMLAEESSCEQGYATAEKALLTLLLIRLSRAWNNQFANLAGLYDERRNLLAETLAYIDRHATEPISPQILASQCYISPGHFRRIFREMTGLTPIDYMNKMRVSLAQNRLQNTPLSITEIAASVGFSDPNYFARLFRALVGCSPSAFREQCQGNATTDI